MLGNNFGGSVRPIKFIQLYLSIKMWEVSSHGYTAQGTVRAISWDYHSRTPTAFLQTAPLKIISFKAVFCAHDLPSPRFSEKFQPSCPSIPTSSLIPVAQCEPIRTNKLRERCSCFLLLLSQHPGILNLVVGVLRLDAMHHQHAAIVNNKPAPQTLTWFGKYTWI